MENDIARLAGRLEQNPHYFPLPVSTFLPVIALVVLTSLQIPLEATPAFSWPLAVLSAFAVIALHKRPEHRRWRYEAIVAGIWLVAIDFIAQSGGSTSTTLWFFIPLMGSVIAHCATRRLRVDNVSLEEKIMSAQIVYRRTHILYSNSGSIVFFIVIAYFSLNKTATGLLIAFSILQIASYMRYTSGQFLGAHPILYLRAFGQKDVFKTFHALIVPAVAQTHVIVGLSRSKERKTLLKRPLGFTTASLYLSSEDNWREWVKLELSRAYGVLFDYSVESGT